MKTVFKQKSSWSTIQTHEQFKNKQQKNEKNIDNKCQRFASKTNNRNGKMLPTHAIHCAQRISSIFHSGFEIN